MKGTRPLSNDEIRKVATSFRGNYATRNRGLFVLGVSTGGRISELLSLRIGDVYQNDKPVSDLLFDKAVVKGGEVSRAVPVNVDGRTAIQGTYRLARGTLWRYRGQTPVISVATRRGCDGSANGTHGAENRL